MNGFEKHGLNHTSASQINMWEDCPAAWVAKYLYGAKFRFGVAPMIGTLVEKVVSDTLMGSSYENALNEAENEFKRSTALITDKKDRERISDIGLMSALALEELKPYGEPEFIQKINGYEQQKIELICNGATWRIPIIGYLDFVFPKHGLITDLKTTLRMPSTMSAPHCRQGAIYKKASGNKTVKFLYVTPKKTGWHEIENENDWLAEIKVILSRQEKFLNLDKEMIKDIMPLNMSSFYWNDAQDVRKELYGV